MSDKTLRFLVATVITMLLVYQIGTLIAGIFGVVWGAASSLAIAAVSFFSARLAKTGGRSSFWFLLPTLLFTVIPMAMTVWNAMTASEGWWSLVVSLTPFFIGFGAPIILLLLIYFELRKRTLNG